METMGFRNSMPAWATISYKTDLFPFYLQSLVQTKSVVQDLVYKAEMKGGWHPGLGGQLGVGFRYLGMVEPC